MINWSRCTGCCLQHVVKRRLVLFDNNYINIPSDQSRPAHRELPGLQGCESWSQSQVLRLVSLRSVSVSLMLLFSDAFPFHVADWRARSAVKQPSAPHRAADCFDITCTVLHRHSCIFSNLSLPWNIQASSFQMCILRQKYVEWSHICLMTLCNKACDHNLYKQ